MNGPEAIRLVALGLACGVASVVPGVLSGNGGAPCSLILHMDKTEFRPGEPIPVACEMKNTGDEPVKIWSCGFWPNHRVVVTDDQGREPDLTPYGVACRERNTLHSATRDRNRPLVLGLGKSYKNHPIDLAKLYDLGPGKYLVTVMYDEHEMEPQMAVVSEPKAFTVED